MSESHSSSFFSDMAGFNDGGGPLLILSPRRGRSNHSLVDEPSNDIDVVSFDTTPRRVDDAFDADDDDISLSVPARTFLIQ
jgi:hypothetical protein